MLNHHADRIQGVTQYTNLQTIRTVWQPYDKICSRAAKLALPLVNPPARTAQMDESKRGNVHRSQTAPGEAPVAAYIHNQVRNSARCDVSFKQASGKRETHRSDGSP
jgi:hypothetical protein